MIPPTTVYGSALLAVYDWWALGFMTRVVLRSPTHLMVERYQSLVGQRHLDVGPGSGYFIDAAMPDGTDLTLLDPNRDVLDHSEKRLARFNPAVVEADVLKPLPIHPGNRSVTNEHYLEFSTSPRGRSHNPTFPWVWLEGSGSMGSNSQGRSHGYLREVGFQGVSCADPCIKGHSPGLNCLDE